jgi:predicted membrane protein
VTPESHAGQGETRVGSSGITSLGMSTNIQVAGLNLNSGKLSSLMIAICNGLILGVGTKKSFVDIESLFATSTAMVHF